MFSRSRKNRQSGFTLLEMLIAVTLLGILLSTVQTTPAGLAEAHVEAAVAEVEMALRFARDESIRTGESYGVFLNDALDRLLVFRVDETTVPPTPVFDVLHPLERKPWDVALRQRLATRQVDLTAAADWEATCNTPGVLIFRDSGTPACGEPLETLLNSAVYTLSQKEIAREVHVDGLTGRVYTP